MPVNNLISENLAILGVIHPQDGATTAVNSGYILVAGYDRVLFIVDAGAITGTIDAKVQQASASGGTGVKDVTGKAITQIAATGDNRIALIELRCDQLDVEGGFEYVRLLVTPTGGTTNLVSALVLGSVARYAPAAHAAVVAETIS